MVKMCYYCKLDREDKDFAKGQTRCRACWKEYHQKRKYGSVRGVVNELIQEQHNSCAICENVFETPKDICLDHCHDTGIIRGLLCNNCNVGIGMLGDTVDRLLKAIAYLES